MQSDEVEAFRPLARRAERIWWLGLYGGSIAVSLIVGFAWTFVVAIPLLVVLVLVAVPLQLRLSKRRWMRRFPGLRDEDLKRTYTWRT